MVQSHSVAAILAQPEALDVRQAHYAIAEVRIPVIDELPLVSVVTPSLNYARYLGECLQSVAVQSHPRIEHVVIDGGSTDDSLAVIQRYARDALELVSGPDQGQADALQRGFDRANGDIFCWLNADDYWLSGDVVSRAVELIQGGADVVTAGGLMVDAESRVTGSIAPLWDEPISRVRYADIVLQPATFWRREVHHQLRIDMHYAFDWRLFIDMYREGARWDVCPEEWAAYRFHGENKSAADPAQRRDEVARILCQEWGSGSLQCRWARLVARRFHEAERSGNDGHRQRVLFVNRILRRLTNWRVYSC
jgi:glycosyltransferase involved in cell wall biosynthesis